MKTPPASTAPTELAGLELLSSAVVLTDNALQICYLNPSAENLFAASRRKMLGRPLSSLLGINETLSTALTNALLNRWSYTGQDIHVAREHAETLHLDCTVSPIDVDRLRLLLEFRAIDAKLRVTREEQMQQQQQINRELIRNLAHEIKNPLGGIRGSAQLLAHELNDAQLKEFTDVIIAEADRLQDLMNRLLHSNRVMRPARMSLHSVLEHVAKLIHAEFAGVRIERDYDPSLPDLTGDREQLIQAILNIVRNAAQALDGKGEIRLQTRVARKVTIAKRKHRLALELRICDDGPGIAADMMHKLFVPLISGREGGSGLGLSLAHSFVDQHQGMIEVASQPGRTCFTVLLPVLDV